MNGPLIAEISANISIGEFSSLIPLVACLVVNNVLFVFERRRYNKAMATLSLEDKGRMMDSMSQGRASMMMWAALLPFVPVFICIMFGLMEDWFVPLFATALVTMMIIHARSEQASIKRLQGSPLPMDYIQFKKTMAVVRLCLMSGFLSWITISTHLTIKKLHRDVSHALESSTNSK